MPNIKKRVDLRCSVCGNDQFAIDEAIQDLAAAPDEIVVKCTDCGRVTTKGKLIEDNSYAIHATIEELKLDVVKQLEKDLKRVLK